MFAAFPWKSALRGLAASRRLAIAAVVCIGLGCAATGAVTTLVSATLLRPLPFPAAERLVRIWLESPGAESRVELSYPDLEALRTAGLRSIERLEASARARPIVFGAEGGRRVEGEAVTSGYFELLGVEAFRGRLFSADDHHAGAEPAVVLGHQAWGTYFGWAPDVVGAVLSTDLGSFTVVGVLPPSFAGTIEEDAGELELWFPLEPYLSADLRGRRDVRSIWTVGRLTAGSALPAARAEVDALGARLAASFPDTHEGRTLTVEPLGDNWREPLRAGTPLLAAAAGLLLLVAAINVTALLTARTLARRRELAIRSALGAARGHLLAQCLLETALVVGTGGMLGLLCGGPLLEAFLRIATVEIPDYVTARPDALTFTIALAVLAAAAVVAGVGPALAGARTDVSAELAEAGRSSSGGKRRRAWGSALVIAEVALTMALVVAASFLVRTYRALATEDLGYDTASTLRVALFVEEADVPAGEDPWPLYRRIRDAVAAEPGVEAAGMVWPTVPIVRPVVQSLRFAGMPEELAAGGLRVGIFAADPGFFSTLRIPLLAGRTFAQTDVAGSGRVMVVGESLARRLAGDGSAAGAVGREVDFGRGATRVIGVVGDTRFGGPQEDAAHRYEAYLALTQQPQRLATVVARTSGDPGALVEPVRRRVAALAPASALDWAETFRQLFRSAFWADTRFVLALVASFSGAGLVLSAVGLYAVLADGVNRRRREIGIRQALGASPGDILRRVLGESLGAVGAGLLLGAALAWGGRTSLSALLYGVSPGDLRSYAAAGGVLLAVGLLASWFPARRAARVAPAEALRDE